MQDPSCAEDGNICVTMLFSCMETGHKFRIYQYERGTHRPGFMAASTLQYVLSVFNLRRQIERFWHAVILRYRKINKLQRTIHRKRPGRDSRAGAEILLLQQGKEQRLHGFFQSRELVFQYLLRGRPRAGIQLQLWLRATGPYHGIVSVL